MTLVQPIAVRRSGSHEDLIRAVATASVLAYHSRPNLPAWAEWLSGPFIKTVRRGTSAQLASVADFAAWSCTQGDAQAFAFAPVEPAQMYPSLQRMQVSNLNRPHEGWPEVGDRGPILAINPEIVMTTGKTAAQVAHGLFAWYLSLDSSQREDWFQEGSQFSIVAPEPSRFAQWAAKAAIHINDAGFTEIEAGSLTVVVSDMTDTI